MYDPAVDKLDKTQFLSDVRKREEYYSTLMDFIRVKCNASVAQDRIKGKGKGKEMVLRYEGEVLENGNWTTKNLEDMEGKDGPGEVGEADVLTVVDGVQWLREKKPVVQDPRKAQGVKRLPSQRPARSELYEVKYEVYLFYLGDLRPIDAFRSTIRTRLVPHHPLPF